MAPVNSIAKAYAEKRMLQGASHALVFKELSELHFNRSQIEHAFRSVEGAHYEICPKKVTEEEIQSPLRRYVEGMVRHGNPSRQKLISAIKKKGWTEKDLDKACKSLAISPKTFKKLKKA